MKNFVTLRDLFNYVESQDSKKVDLTIPELDGKGLVMIAMFEEDDLELFVPEGKWIDIDTPTYKEHGGCRLYAHIKYDYYNDIINVFRFMGGFENTLSNGNVQHIIEYGPTFTLHRDTVINNVNFGFDKVILDMLCRIRDIIINSRES